MAPTVVHPGRPVDREKRPRAGPVERSLPSQEAPPTRRSDLVSRVRYCNTLPDIPSDPKFINYPFSSNRYVQYKPTSLEKNYKYEVLTEHDLGVIIDLISPDAYAVLPEMTIHPTDEKLLEDDILMPQDAKRSRHHHVNVSWLRKTEYISTEMTRYQPQTMDKIEATVGFATRRKAQQEEDNTYTDRESQLEAIEKTFEDVKKPIKAHYSKPGVVAVEELCVFPDFEMWKYPCAQVIFDSDPAPIGRPVPAQIEEMSQAMIRGVMDESGEQFVAYFLPSEDTLIKRKRDKDEGLEYKDEEEYDYSMAREYNWNVKNKASKGYEENYFLVVRNEGVFYNELETRVRLSKRRLKQGQQPNNSRLVVIHRPLIAQEHKTQRYRERMLEPPCEDEEEDEEEEEEMLPVDNDDVASRGSRSRSRSGSRSGSGSRSRSHSGSRSRSHSGSPHSKAGSARSKSVSRSRSRSGSRSVSKARSHSRSTSRSRSRSRSKSQTKIKSRSRSGSSESRSRSRSKSKDKSRASSRSKSRSLSKSRSRSPSKSRSQSPSKSRSQSPSKSRSQSPSKSRSPSPSKSRSHSPSKSRSRSQSRSRSHSRSNSRSRSKVKSITPSRSRSKSFTPGRSSRSRSRSPSKSPRSIGSSSPAHSERSSASGSSGKRSRSRSLSPEEKPKKKIKP